MIASVESKSIFFIIYIFYENKFFLKSKALVSKTLFSYFYEMNKLLLLFLFPSLLFSQSWIDLMQDPSNNFYDTQKEFEDYWENKTIEKGKGWKQFKRWENFIKPRVFPDGVQYPEVLLQEYKNVVNANNSFFGNE